MYSMSFLKINGLVWCSLECLKSIGLAALLSMKIHYLKNNTTSSIPIDMADFPFCS